jgi:hypothetical protein
MPGKVTLIMNSSRMQETIIAERKMLLAMPGVPGPAGDPGARVKYAAGQATSSGRLLTALSNQAVYFDPSGNFEPAGIALNAAIQGDEVTVILNGPIEISGWGLTPGAAYFAGPNGTLLSDPAQCVGRVQQIGVAEDANTLIINIQPAIIL